MKFKENYTQQLQRLNEYQKAAVFDESSACLVNANVGSGKTTVLITKVMYLHYEKQIPYEQMVVLTFTNKAADEIKERLYALEPEITEEQLWGFGTFHSVCLTMLKKMLPVEKLGYTKEFMVLDPDEELEMAEQLILTYQLKIKYKNRLKKRLEHTHAATAVVGISGGLDSTLALLVMVKAFDLIGKDHKDIVAVTMPGFGTTDRTYDNAVSLIKSLGATFREVSIVDSVRVHFKDIGQDEAVHDVTYENGQARERTQILMDIANKSGGMVIGTGDMSELALGWATYNGDHMSMYGVNASVPKTLVRHLVCYYADTCADETLQKVLYDVLDTPVSPELLPPEDGKISQKTEDIVGPYELHDFFLYYMLRWTFPPKKIFRLAQNAFAGEYDDETILKWLKTFYRRFFMQQFKRSCLPDGPKVGSVAVSPRGDLRMPSDASAALWMKELEQIRI